MYNKMRVKASDFDKTENNILTVASTRLYALSACQDPLPSSERESAMYAESWDYARVLLEKRITHDQGVFKVVGPHLNTLLC